MTETLYDLRWPGTKVLVTGGGGFIGSQLVKRLVAEGAAVSAFIRYNSQGHRGHLDDLPREVSSQVEVFSGDLRDHRAVGDAIRGCEVVFHLAALIGIPYSYKNPVDVVQTNVLGTLNVLNAARDFGVSRVVHTSTSEVYGTARYAPIDEDHPLQAQSPYAATKISADKLVESYHKSFGLPCVTVRPFNTYGPGQSARAVIPTIVVQALHSPTIRLGSLDTRRDFNFVTDTADGFIAVGGSAACLGEVVNLGTGVDVTVGAVTELVMEITGRRVPVAQDDQRLRPASSEVFRLISDNRKALRLAGWQPKVALRDGLASTVEWVAAHPDAYSAVGYVT